MKTQTDAMGNAFTVRALMKGARPTGYGCAVKRGDFARHLTEALEALGVPSSPAEVRAQLLRTHPAYKEKPHLTPGTASTLATTPGVVRIEQSLYALARWTFQTEASEIRPAAAVVLEALRNLGRPVTLVELADECVCVWPELENYQALRRFVDKGIKDAGAAVVRVGRARVAAREHQHAPIQEPDVEIYRRRGRPSFGWSFTQNALPHPGLTPRVAVGVAAHAPPLQTSRERLSGAEQFRHLDAYGLFIAGELAAGEGDDWSLQEWAARLYQHLGDLFDEEIVKVWVQENRDRLPHSAPGASTTRLCASRGPTRPPGSRARPASTA